MPAGIAKCVYCTVYERERKNCPAGRKQTERYTVDTVENVIQYPVLGIACGAHLSSHIVDNSSSFTLQKRVSGYAFRQVDSLLATVELRSRRI